jgi:hypothetical protein
MAKQKSLTIEELYPHCEALSTADQIKLKEFLEKTLQEKLAKASQELDLITNKGK